MDGVLKMQYLLFQINQKEHIKLLKFQKNMKYIINMMSLLNLEDILNMKKIILK